MLGHKRRADALALVILAAAVAILLGRVIRGEILVESDILAYYYPMKTALRQLFLRGSSLVWNPYLGEGQPLAANPEHEIFYPFTWLLFVLPVRHALAISEVSHLALAFWGMRRLLRRLRVSELAALAGSSAWSFGGLFISSMHFFPVFFAWTWVPWLVETALMPSGKPRTFLRGALFGGLILLAGEPVSALLAALLYLAAFLSRPFTRERSGRAAATAILAVALGAATLLPGAALARKGIRGQGLPDASANRMSFPPVRFVELLFPRAMGYVAPHDYGRYFGWWFYTQGSWPFFWGLYGGALLLPAAAAGLAGGRRSVRVFALIGSACLLVSLGPPGLVWSFLRRTFPPWRGIRFPEKFLEAFVFSIVIAMSAGFDRIRRSPCVRRGVLAWLAALGVVFAFGGEARGLWQSFFGAYPRLSASVGTKTAVAAISRTLWTSSGRYALFGLLLLALIVASRRSRRATALAAAALAIATGLDAITASRDFMRTRTVGWVEQPPRVVRRILAAGPPPRLVDFLPPEPGIPNLVREKNGPFDRNRALWVQPVQWGIPVALDQDFDFTYIYSEMRARDLISQLAPGYPRVLSRLLAGRCVGAFMAWQRPMSIDDPVTLLGIPGVRPEVDSATSVIRFRGNQDFLEKSIAATGDLARAAFVEEPVPANLPDPPSEARIGRVTLKNDFVSFLADSPSPSLVRIARTNDGNWRAAVDGRPSPVVTVDLSMIGIALPAGSHAVTIRYRDNALLAGMGISLAAAALMAALFVASVRRPRLQRPGDAGSS